MSFYCFSFYLSLSISFSPSQMINLCSAVVLSIGRHAEMFPKSVKGYKDVNGNEL